jgi:hypothetical protein
MGSFYFAHACEIMAYRRILESMKYVNAELTPGDGEEAMMQAIRNSSIPAILGNQEITIPVCNVDYVSPILESRCLRVPISDEDPIHVAIDSRFDQHNVLPKASKPEIRAEEILDGTLTEDQQAWVDSYRSTSIKTYQLIGTVAATDLRPNPVTTIERIDKKDLQKTNEAFDEMIGEWGALLSAKISYAALEETEEVFTGVQFAIMESEEEFAGLRGKDPTGIFIQ